MELQEVGPDSGIYHGHPNLRLASKTPIANLRDDEYKPDYAYALPVLGADPILPQETALRAQIPLSNRVYIRRPSD
jgi:hypothetical protein